MANSRFSIAVHTLALLAYEDDQPLKSEYIACSVKTNPVVIRRLLSDLSEGGIVVSQAGAAGGSRLAKKPEDITLFEVYRAIEGGEIFALHRSPPDEKCDIGRSIQEVLTAIQDHLDKAVEKSLGQINLAEVLQMIETANGYCKLKKQLKLKNNESI